MKKVIAILLFPVILWGCDTGADKEGVVIKDSIHHHEAGSATFELNNGAKWKSDESTNRNVNELQTIVAHFNQQPDRSVLSYSQLAGELKADIDKMISECKMQGSDHEALHKWLEPLLKQADQLQQTKNEEDAVRLYNGISEQLKLYNQYFE